MREGLFRAKSGNWQESQPQEQPDGLGNYQTRAGAWEQGLEVKPCYLRVGSRLGLGN